MAEEKLKLFVLSALLYFAMEVILGNAFTLLLGQRYLTYNSLPLADAYSSVLSPLLFAAIVLLLFDAFKDAYYSNHSQAGRLVFVGVVFAVLGPLYEWLTSIVIKAVAGVDVSTYHVLPVLNAYTSLLAPAYFFAIGIAFVFACTQAKLLE